MSSIEERADLRYFDTRLAVLGASDGIPEAAALRYCHRGHLLVAEVAEELVGFILWHREPDPTDHTDWMSELVTKQVAGGLPWDDREKNLSGQREETDHLVR